MSETEHKDPVRTVLDRLEGVKQTGPRQWEARCPVHDDRHASLSIGRGDDGRALIDCKAGCAVGEVVKALGMKISDLFAGPPAAPPGPASRRAPATTARKPGATYRTPEEAFAAVAQAVKGECVGQWSYPGDTFRVGRFDLHAGGKTYRPIRRAGNAWTLGDPSGALPLYRGDELPAGDAEAVVVVEGEKCADAARAVGLFAVASAHGAKSAAKTDWKPLAGHEVVILPDNDDTGRKYAQEVATILSGLTPPAVVRVVELPGLGDGGDIADWIDADGPMGEKDAGTIKAAVLELAKAAKPWTPAPAKSLEGEPVITTLADVTPRPVEWLWPSRIALGKLTLVVGDPGLGKSYITLDLAGRVSKGTAWPDCPQARRAPGGVVLLSAEDDLADTIRPRLDAAGADVSRIAAITTVKRYDLEKGKDVFESFNLTDHLPALERAIKQVGDCRLVVIDPISAYLGGTDSHKNADVRGLLMPLSELAARHGVALIAVSHLRKGEGPAMYRAIGSLAFIAAARAAFAVTKDPQDPTGERRLVLPIKHNLGNDKTGLAYRLLAPYGGVPAVSWEREPVALSADEALNSAGPAGDDENTTERDEAAAWLRDNLTEGPLEAKAVYAQARQDGISKRTLDRAKRDLGVIARREGFGAGGSWRWKLPQTPDDDAEGGQAIGCRPPDGQGPTPQTVATFGETGNLWEKPQEDGDSDAAQEGRDAKGCQAPETGNLSPRPADGAALDPDTPGPTDRLTAEQYKRYQAIYYSRPADMPPAERQARAWRAALRRREGP